MLIAPLIRCYSIGSSLCASKGSRTRPCERSSTRASRRVTRPSSPASRCWAARRCLRWRCWAARRWTPARAAHARPVWNEGRSSRHVQVHVNTYHRNPTQLGRARGSRSPRAWTVVAGNEGVLPFHTNKYYEHTSLVRYYVNISFMSPHHKEPQVHTATELLL